MAEQRMPEPEGKRNILFVTSTLYWGGAQKVVSILANGFAKRYNVTVAYCFDSGRSHPFSTQIGLRKLPEYPRGAGVLERTLCEAKQIRALKKLKKELGIEASVSLGNDSNFLNAMSKGPECVICCERSNPQKSWGPLFHLTRLSFRIADHVVFQSEQVRSIFGPRIREKSTILKNPVQIPEPAFPQREKKIVALGRLTAQKNHLLLLRSFARFREEYPEYRLHLFGAGEMEGQIREAVRTLGLSGQVVLEGEDPDVHAKIRDAEMFVLSSDYEGLSNALLECMAMGIACVSTRCEGSVNVIRDGVNGLLADVGDEQGFAEAMRTLARDPGLRLRLERQAMEDLKAYDKDLVLPEWEDLVRRCL